MDMISHLAGGFLTCMQPFNLLMLLIGYLSPVPPRQAAS